MDAVRLVFPLREGQLVIDANVVETAESAHTGKPLRRVETDLTIPAADARLVHSAFEAPQLIDEQGDEWNGAIKVESYRDPAGLHNLQIELQELEALRANTIEFEGFVMHPSEYEERAEDGRISVEFRAHLDDDETERLRELQLSGDLYFPTVRRGIDERPRQMRFGRVLWQPQDGGGADHKIVLVEEGQEPLDAAFKALAGDPQVPHLMNAVEQLLSEGDALLTVLEQNGILDAASIAKIRDAGGAAIGTKRFRFFEVDDLSEWK